jgi:hypothetical protein
VLVIEADQFLADDAPTEAAIVASHRVRRWLERQPEALDQADAFRIAIAARRPSTWG